MEELKTWPYAHRVPSFIQRETINYRSTFENDGSKLVPFFTQNSLSRNG